jgi:hypothetical protein
LQRQLSRQQCGKRKFFIGVNVVWSLPSALAELQANGNVYAVRRESRSHGLSRRGAVEAAGERSIFVNWALSNLLIWRQ